MHTENAKELARDPEAWVTIDMKQTMLTMAVEVCYIVGSGLGFIEMLRTTYPGVVVTVGATLQPYPATQVELPDHLRHHARRTRSYLIIKIPISGSEQNELVDVIRQTIVAAAAADEGELRFLTQKQCWQLCKAPDSEQDTIYLQQGEPQASLLALMHAMPCEIDWQVWSTLYPAEGMADNTFRQLTWQCRILGGKAKDVDLPAISSARYTGGLYRTHIAIKIAKRHLAQLKAAARNVGWQTSKTPEQPSWLLGWPIHCYGRNKDLHRNVPVPDDMPGNPATRPDGSSTGLRVLTELGDVCTLDPFKLKGQHTTMLITGEHAKHTQRVLEQAIAQHIKDGHVTWVLNHRPESGSSLRALEGFNPFYYYHKVPDMLGSTLAAYLATLLEDSAILCNSAVMNTRILAAIERAIGSAHARGQDAVVDLSGIYMALRATGTQLAELVAQGLAPYLADGKYANFFNSDEPALTDRWPEYGVKYTQMADGEDTLRTKAIQAQAYIAFQQIVVDTWLGKKTEPRVIVADLALLDMATDSYKGVDWSHQMLRFMRKGRAAWLLRGKSLQDIKNELVRDNVKQFGALHLNIVPEQEGGSLVNMTVTGIRAGSFKARC